ncbi:MAG: hypothetical protein AAFO07_33600 [Bacteroidota bacterium]
MKRYVSCFFLIVMGLISSNLNAQTSIGISAGYVKAWQNYGDVDLPEDAETYIYGSQFRVKVYKKLGNRLSIGVEPGYVRRGAACIPGWIGEFVGDTKFLLEYADLPLSLSYQQPLFKSKWSINGRIGYGISYLASATRVEEDLMGQLPTNRVKMDLVNDSILNRLDHGLNLGAGIHYRVGENQIFAEMIYYRAS